MTVKTKSIINPIKYIANMFTRFSLVLFIVIVTSGLIFSILTLNNILTQPYANSDSASSSNFTVDQATIDSLNSLNTSNENLTAATLPSGRTNPFSE